MVAASGAGFRPRTQRGFDVTKHYFGTSHVPLTPAVRAGDFVYVSGQVPVGADGAVVAGGVAEQTEQVLRNIEKVLALAGCAMSDVVKTTVWLEDRDDFAAFNSVYARHFPTNPPARSTAESRLMIDIKVEIEAIAYKPL
jgi:2-iminobutanoate/2-iminopropanoate deaminase